MATTQAFCLRRNNHPSDMIEDFEKMFKDEFMVDVTLSCEDGTIHAHRVVLSACSSYFKNVFSKLRNPYHYPVVIIKDMSFTDLKAIIEFVYRGEVTVPQDQLSSVLRSAETLKIKGLSDVNSNGKTTNIGNHNRSSHSKKRKKRRRKMHCNTGDSGNDDQQHQQQDSEKMSENEDGFHDKHTRESSDDGSDFSDEDEEQNHSTTRITPVGHCNDDRSFNETASTVEGDIEPSRLLEQTMITGDGNENGTSVPRFQTPVSIGNVQPSVTSVGSEVKTMLFEEGSLVPQLTTLPPALPQNDPNTLPPSSSQNHTSSIPVSCSLGHYDSSGLSSIAGPSNMSQIVNRPSQQTQEHFGHTSQGPQAPQIPIPHPSHSTPHLTAQMHQVLGCHSLSSLSIESLSGRRHYQCPVCLKAFSEKGNMKRHTQIHLQQRNRYVCDLCTKCFAWKDNFNRHRRIAHSVPNAK